jgi:Protein of unknown function (DUF4031)
MVDNEHMAVYVYMYGGQKPKAMTYSWPHPWFGLTADTEEELHPFAEDIGMDRQLYRPRMAGSEVLPLVGHYDLDEGERDRAVAKGAIPQTHREHDKMLRQLAKERGIKLR